MLGKLNGGTDKFVYISIVIEQTINASRLFVLAPYKNGCILTFPFLLF